MSDAQSSGTEIFDGKVLDYLEEVLDILDFSEFLSTTYSVIIEDKTKLRQFAFEYKQIDAIRKELEKFKIEKDLGKFIEELVNFLSFIQKNNPNLYSLLQENKFISIQDLQLLARLLMLIKRRESLNANIDIILDTINKIEDDVLAAILRKEVLQLLKELSELSTLEKVLNDISQWSLHAHTESDFYIKRVDSYFTADLSKYGFAGLDKLNDKDLREKIYGSSQIRILIAISKLTYKPEDQIKFLKSLIAIIKMDISGDVWVQNKYTRIFLDRILQYASSLKNIFKNDLIAMLLVQRAKIIGEQPFKLIELLEQFIKSIENSVIRKNGAIENAKQYLINIFNSKRENLSKSLENRRFRLLNTLESSDFSKGIYKLISKRLEAVEKAVNNLWNQRRNQFKGIFSRVYNQHRTIEPLMNDIIEKKMIDKDTRKFMLKLKALNDFRVHKRMLGQVLQKKEAAFPYLIMLDFDLARMRDIFYELRNSELFIEEKLKSLTEAANELKASMPQLLDLNLILLRWLYSVKLQIVNVNLEGFRNQILAFGGKYYGR